MRKPRPNGEYATKPIPNSRSTGSVHPSGSRVQSEYSDCSALIGWVAWALRMVSGPASETVARLLGGCGATVSVLPGPAGAAATRKLLRSVFYKGMAAAAIEALRAARAAGSEDWLREHIAAELAAADEGTLARLEQGSHRHARRREHEMAAAGDLLDELSVPPRVTRASQLWLKELATEG